MVDKLAKAQESNGVKKGKSCFLVCPIGIPGSDTRKHSDLVYKFIIQKILPEFGYSLIERSDDIGEPGSIPSQIINRLMECDLVIADLTGHNPNVFYELGVRHTFGRPYIQLINEKEKIPFDVGSMRTIAFDITDLESVENCKYELKKQLQSIEETGDVDSPVKIAISAKQFTSNTDPKAAWIKSIEERLVKVEMDQKQDRLSKPKEVNSLLKFLGTEWGKELQLDQFNDHYKSVPTLTKDVLINYGLAAITPEKKHNSGEQDDD